jgi:PEP-CTERM motif
LFFPAIAGRVLQLGAGRSATLHLRFLNHLQGVFQMRKQLSIIAAAAALATAGAAQAGTVLATDLLGGPQAIDGTTAVSLAGSAALDTKTINGITAVGVVGGASGNEIDIGENMTASFSAGVVVGNVHLAFLYDGPEYNDVNEVAQLTASLLGGGTLSATLTAIGATSASASAGSASIVGGQDADSVGAALWSWDNPFGNALVTSIKFESIPGVPAAGCTFCTNQSDYSVYSLTAAVPEPGTYALMAAGLGVMGFLGRRRRPV